MITMIWRLSGLILGYDPDLGLEAAITALCDKAEQAVRDGKVILHLTDKNQVEGHYLVHAAFATGAVHHRLIKNSLRSDANILVETGTARDSHHFAVLMGFGATAVYPWLTYEVIGDMIRGGTLICDTISAFKSYRRESPRGF